MKALLYKIFQAFLNFFKHTIQCTLVRDKTKLEITFKEVVYEREQLEQERRAEK